MEYGHWFQMGLWGTSTHIGNMVKIFDFVKVASNQGK